MTEPITPPATNPPPVTEPPATPPAPKPVVHQAPPESGNVLAAVNALPEKLVDAVRELIPQNPPAPPAPPAQQNQPPVNQPPATPRPAETGKRRSVGEWFFGVKK